MKDQLKKMNYTEFKVHLNSENISYEEKFYDDFSKMVEVCPISDNYESRKFDLTRGQQYFEKKDLRKRIKLDFFNYAEYIKYLTERSIKYDEIRDWDFFLFNYILVTPISKKLKPRTFFADCGDQAFEGDYVE